MKNIIISIIFLIITSCSLFDGGEDTHNEMSVYKTRADYSNNFCVLMNAAKTQIDGYKVMKGKWPVPLIDGYLVDRESPGINAAFLSITYDDYAEKYHGSLSSDSMMKLILDKDPFLEYYQCDNYYNNFYIDPTKGGYYSVDTAKIDEEIRKGELTKYFERLK